MMNKFISYVSVVVLVSATILISCKDSEPEQEILKFPTELFPIEVSNISNARFFIGGEEIFDTELCRLFMRSEWIQMIDGSQRYNFFDEDDFMNDYYIPQNITFIAQDTVFIGYSRFIAERNNSFFVFHPYNYQYSTNNSNDFRENFNFEITANGSYTDLKFDVVNYRYHRSVSDTPLWEDTNNGTRTFGTAGRINGKINYDNIVISMHPTDTFVFQQYQVKYQVFKQEE